MISWGAESYRTSNDESIYGKPTAEESTVRAVFVGGSRLTTADEVSNFLKTDLAATAIHDVMLDHFYVGYSDVI